MPKVHELGTKHFVQVINFPVKWKWKVVVRGWTQEIEEPFRTSTPLIFRLPFHKALVLGKWSGQREEEDALSAATEMRVLVEEDFDEENGWTPAQRQDYEESIGNLNS